jgi:hypothetical protein
VIRGHVRGGFGRFRHFKRAFAIYNVSVVDEAYPLVNAQTVKNLPDLLKPAEGSPVAQ